MPEITIQQAQSFGRLISDALHLVIAEHGHSRSVNLLHGRLDQARAAMASAMGVDAATIVPDGGIKPTSGS